MSGNVDFIARCLSGDLVNRVDNIENRLGNTLVESMGRKIDIFNNITTIANCTAQECGNVRFAEKSANVVFNSHGTSKIKINVPTQKNWESVTIVFYVPKFESWGSTSGIRLRFGFNTLDTINVTYYYVTNKIGWNILKIPRNKISNAPDQITSVYVYGYAGSSVPANTDYRSIIFDSVIFDMRMKPTFVLNFDQWWSDTNRIGAYDYCFNNGIPFTLMSKNYDTMSADFKALAHKAHNLYGCENAYYACYGSTNTKFTNITSYNNGKDYVKELKNDFYNEFPEEFLKSYGCTQMTLNELTEKVLVDDGIGFIRGGSCVYPHGYFDKSDHVIASIGISNSDVSDINTIKSMIDDLVTYGSCGLYFTHGVCDDAYTKTNDGTGSNAIKLTIFKEMIDYLVTLRDQDKIQILTLRDLWDRA